MSCPVCDRGKARRSCPALGHSICTVCCGTKRLVEIDCPGDCPHLAAAREHPAAAVRRQQEQDVALLLPSIRPLTERQHQLFFLFHTLIARHRPEGLARLLDEDVAEAAAAAAATFETAARGIVYEHAPASLPAQRLAAEMTTMVQEMREQGAVVYDREIAITLRAIEQGARETASSAGGGPATYLELLARLMQVNRATGKDDDPAIPPQGSIVLP